MGISCFPTELVKGAVGGRSRLSWGGGGHRMGDEGRGDGWDSLSGMGASCLCQGILNIFVK